MKKKLKAEKISMRGYKFEYIRQVIRVSKLLKQMKQKCQVETGT